MSEYALYEGDIFITMGTLVLGLRSKKGNKTQ